MSDEKEMKLTLQTYSTLIKMLDNEGLKYETDQEKMMIKFNIRGENLPMDFVFRFLPERSIVTLFSFIPFNVSEDKRQVVAIALAYANYGLIDGCFDMDFSDGEIKFRLASCYSESLFSEALFKFMFCATFMTVRKYNDRLLMLAKGMIDLEKFIELEKSKQYYSMNQIKYHFSTIRKEKKIMGFE